MRPVKVKDYFVCPNCGEELPIDAKFCPECGSDDQTGWSEDAEDTGVDVPAEYTDADYDEFIQKEFGEKKNPKRIFWLIVVFVIIILLIFLILFFRYL